MKLVLLFLFDELRAMGRSLVELAVVAFLAAMAGEFFAVWLLQ